MAFELPKLAYGYNALEPYIDAMTMEIHHSKHHAAYTNNLNAAVTGTEMEKLSIEELLANISKHPVAVRNNGGGFYNHNLFWTFLAPNAGGQPKGDALDAINKYFGSFEGDYKRQRRPIAREKQKKKELFGPVHGAGAAPDGILNVQHLLANIWEIKLIFMVADSI